MAPGGLEWLWIPLTIWAGFAQTLRNAAQRHLIADLGTLGATLVRFLYGLPFAAAWLVIVLLIRGDSIPQPNLGFLAWVTEGALAQIAATALLLRVMAERNFTLGVAYSKTELVQVAVFALVFLGDEISLLAAIAVMLATIGVLFLSPADKERPLAGFIRGWTSRTALLGLASGTGFALAAVGYRGAALEVDAPSFLVAAAFTLFWAQAIQTVALGGWLLVRQPGIVGTLLQVWRPSIFAGFMGAAASVGWFTAMAIEPVAHVRTLGLVELFFAYLLSRRIFLESLSRSEVVGIALLSLGLVVIILGG
ncbi:MAG: EamA/RhaT family transporter [Dehalococcoidia bacterium]|nr:EamA/RhaT family transporter [Dehalococcoidia bacterium]